MKTMYEPYDLNTAEGNAVVEAYETERAEKVKEGQQLWARIKRTSKYYGQGTKGELFKVRVTTLVFDDYMVLGGPGGQYRLRDVNLYVVEKGIEVKIA